MSKLWVGQIENRGYIPDKRKDFFVLKFLRVSRTHLCSYVMRTGDIFD